MKGELKMNRVLKLQKLNAEFETKNAKVIFTAGYHIQIN